MNLIGKILAVVLSVLVLLLAAIVAASWAPDRPLAELKQRWAQPPSTFVQVQGMYVHLRDEGPRTDPVPIVLLHGTSSSLHTWDGWAQELKSNRRVIRFDLPGFGLTGPSPDGDYRIERYVRFVAAMLDELGISHCVLAGNSSAPGGGASEKLVPSSRMARMGREELPRSRPLLRLHPLPHTSCLRRVVSRLAMNISPR